MVSLTESSGTDDSEHWTLVRDLWRKLELLRKDGKVVIDGGSLDLASIVAVSRCKPIYFSNNRNEYADTGAKDTAPSANWHRAMPSRRGSRTVLMSSTITSQRVASSMVWSP